VICDKDSFQLPKNKEEKCDEKCDCGYFKDVNSDGKKRCYPCKDGEYSTNDTDPFKCISCPEATYGPKVLNVTKFHLIHTHGNDFFCQNECKSSSSSLCEIYNYKGWKFRKDGVIPGNNLPQGIELTLAKDINIIQEEGFIEFSYEILNLKEEEYFYVELDGFMENISITKGKYTKKITLHNGQHKIKFIFKKETTKSEITNTDNSLIISAMSIFGSDEGGATECLKCKGVI
jgi:hypothetical protein